jgi:uncharacterized protein with NAD-binding domain and iron-sulfur cluster
MNRNGNGKIARLPRKFQEQLNVRIQDGEQGKPILTWLNSLPSMQAILVREFGGTLVSKQNLSEWRKRGYREWLIRQDAMEAVSRATAGTEALREQAGVLTGNMALWLAARYLVAAEEMEKQEGRLDWKMLREFCRDLVALRRGDLSSARLLIEAKRREARECSAKNRCKRNFGG